MKYLTFDQLNREVPLDRAIYNIWHEYIFNECSDSERVEVIYNYSQQTFFIKCHDNGYNEEIFDEQGHYYFTEDMTVVIYLDNPKHCQKFIAFERTQDYMEIAYI